MGYSRYLLTCDVKGCKANLPITDNFHPEWQCRSQDRDLGNGWRTEEPFSQGGRGSWKVLCPDHRASDLTRPPPSGDEWSAERFRAYRDGMLEHDLQRAAEADCSHDQGCVCGRR